jgi:N12 class adenine-specific DNA methylase
MSQTNKTSLEEVIKYIRSGSEQKLWRIDRVQLEDGREVAIFVGRAKMASRDATFPAVVIRVEYGDYVRDYTIGLGAVRFLLSWLDMGSESRIKLLREIVEKTGPISRKLDAEVENL